MSKRNNRNAFSNVAHQAKYGLRNIIANELHCNGKNTESAGEAPYLNKGAKKEVKARYRKCFIEKLA